MSPAEWRQIDESLRLILEIAGKARGWDAVIHVKTDGRVCIDFENAAGHVKQTIRGDLIPNSAMPLPSVALHRYVTNLDGEGGAK